MNATKGYFCLVQYCPDIARHEAANVGIVLFSPEHRFFKARLIRGNQRIRRFFGEDADNFRHLNAMKDALANRLEIERAEFSTLEDLQTFVATRANKIILTQPKPVKVFNPEQDLEELYQELVLEPPKSLSNQLELPIRRRLDEALMASDVRRFIRTNITVHVPTLGEQLEIPYAYQNGRLNLIQPVEFTQQSATRVKTAACRTAMEGLSLYKHEDPQLGPLQLVVVASFADPNPESESVVRGIFHEANVELFTPETLDSLKQEIISKGHPDPRAGELFK